MKKNWERRQPFVQVSPELLAAVLAPVFPRAVVVSCELVRSGLVNTNYRLRLARLDGQYLLRIYARDPAACGKERALADLLADRLPIPEVVHSDASCSVLALPFALHRWVDGVVADAVIEGGSAPDRAAVAGACGRVLASLQDVTFAGPGFLDERLAISGGPLTPAAYRDWMPAMLGDASVLAALGPDLAQAVDSFSRSNAWLIEAAQNARNLVHADFNGANILVRRAGNGWEVAAVLDWEFAFSGTALFDLSNMLRHYREFGSSFEEPFVAGFRAAGGALPPEWRRTGRLLDLMALCSILAQPDGGATMRRAVTELIRAYVLD